MFSIGCIITLCVCVLFSFFKQNWCLAIYHDRFSDFEQELQQITSAPVGAFISSFSTPLFPSYFCSFCSLLLKSFLDSGSYYRLKLAGRGMVFTSPFLPPSEQTSGCAEAASCPISDLQQKPAAHVFLPGSAVRPQAEGGTPVCPLVLVHQSGPKHPLWTCLSSCPPEGSTGTRRMNSGLSVTNQTLDLLEIKASRRGRGEGGEGGVGVRCLSTAVC